MVHAQSSVYKNPKDFSLVKLSKSLISYISFKSFCRCFESFQGAVKVVSRFFDEEKNVILDFASKDFLRTLKIDYQHAS